MADVIRFGLSPIEITQAVKRVKAHKELLARRVDLLLGRLISTGMSIAKVQIKALSAVDTGELEESISCYFPSSNAGVIYVGAWYGIFVEFGTGVKGEGAPHPKPPADWHYDINKHGDDGWWYFSDRDGNWHWTKGMESRPFMYLTAKELETKISKIAKKVFVK